MNATLRASRSSLAMEETKALGIRFKSAKTKAGRRNITLPTIAIETLREHRRQLLETRLLLGQGEARARRSAVRQSRRPAAPTQRHVLRLGRSGGTDRCAGNYVPWAAAYPRQSAHCEPGGYRHHQQAPRHAKPSVTLAIYAHMFHTDDSKAAAAINAALG